MRFLIALLLGLSCMPLHAEADFYERTLGMKPYKDKLEDDKMPQIIRYRMGTFNFEKPGKPVLVVFLHGAGQRGRDNESQISEVVPGIIKFIRDNSIKAVVVAPQCYPDAKWVNVDWGTTEHTPAKPSRQLQLAMTAVNQAIKQYDVDSNRIYLCGISMGGYGAWDYLSREPGMFAAALIACGGADSKEAPKLTKIPIKVTHGEVDNIVPLSRSQDIVKAIKDAGGKNIDLEIVPNRHHACWGEAFSDQKLKWLFDQKK